MVGLTRDAYRSQERRHARLEGARARLVGAAAIPLEPERRRLLFCSWSRTRLGWQLDVLGLRAAAARGFRYRRFVKITQPARPQSAR